MPSAHSSLLSLKCTSFAASKLRLLPHASCTNPPFWAWFEQPSLSHCFTCMCSLSPHAYSTLLHFLRIMCASFVAALFAFRLCPMHDAHSFTPDLICTSFTAAYFLYICICCTMSLAHSSLLSLICASSIDNFICTFISWALISVLIFDSWSSHMSKPFIGIWWLSSSVGMCICLNRICRCWFTFLCDIVLLSDGADEDFLFIRAASVAAASFVFISLSWLSW